MRIIAAVLALVLFVMLWQHLRYLHARRNAVEDRQPILHSPSNFHVITYLEIGEGSDLITELSRLRREIENTGSAHVVYAGQAAFTLASSQLGPQTWDAVIFIRYPSRESYDAQAKSAGHREALAAFSQTYSYGMRRNPLVNALIPQLLLAVRIFDIARGNWKVEDLAPIPAPNDPQQARLLESRIGNLLKLRSVNDDAILIFNLALPGNEEQRTANSSYDLKMLTRMAALAHGPMHVGQAVALDGNARFEQAILVYYPGVSYFADLVGSRFYQGIMGDKQLGDTLVVPTVPILSKLE
ncbi:hypothetical protein MK489_22635 [Myxococcota bacterium]|nr:hypothetical protein [Myxococcota bacterium]